MSKFIFFQQHSPVSPIAITANNMTIKLYFSILNNIKYKKYSYNNKECYVLKKYCYISMLTNYLLLMDFFCDSRIVFYLCINSDERSF